MAPVTPLVEGVLLGGSAFLAGAINALAGGGTLLTYPALLAAGISPIHANATSTICLVQGSLAAFWGFRKELHNDGRLLVALAAPSLVGSVLGALLLLALSERSFALVVPWLILGATLLFLLADRLRRRFLERPEAAITGAAAGDPRRRAARWSRSTAASSARRRASSCSPRSACAGCATSIA